MPEPTPAPAPSMPPGGYGDAVPIDVGFLVCVALIVALLMLLWIGLRRLGDAAGRRPRRGVALGPFAGHEQSSPLGHHGSCRQLWLRGHGTAACRPCRAKFAAEKGPC
ncbi:MAG: hypothetical protein ACRDQ7_15695 [Haloechinothrix sp.]